MGKSGIYRVRHRKNLRGDALCAILGTPWLATLGPCTATGGLFPSVQKEPYPAIGGLSGVARTLYRAWRVRS